MPYLIRDGVRLAYDDVGAGGPALLCLHGNSCNREFFRPQIEYFKASLWVVALDLRGHGQSDAPRQNYSPPALADDCAWVCSELGLEQVVAVGHSIAGSVAAELVKAHPDLVRAVVALDSTLMPDLAVLRRAFPPVMQKLKQPDYLNGLRDFVDPFFAPGDSHEVREWVWQQMSRTPAHVILSLFEEFMNWRDLATPRITQPFLYVAGFHWRTDAGELARVCPQVKTVQVKESGHFLTLTAAEKVNGLLQDFLTNLRLV